MNDERRQQESVGMGVGMGMGREGDGREKEVHVVTGETVQHKHFRKQAIDSVPA
jgi:hypothetical protein